MGRWLFTLGMFVLTTSSCTAPGERGGKLDSDQGTTLTIGIEAAPVDVPFRKFMPLIKERLGVDLEIVTLEYGSLFEKVLTDLITGTGSFDIIVYFTRFNGDYMGRDSFIPWMISCENIPQLRRCHSCLPGAVLRMGGPHLRAALRRRLFPALLPEGSLPTSPGTGGLPGALRLFLWRLLRPGISGTCRVLHPKTWGETSG